MGFQFCVFRSVIKEIEKKYETLLLTFINVIHAGKITQHFQINQQTFKNYMTKWIALTYIKKNVEILNFLSMQQHPATKSLRTPMLSPYQQTHRGQALSHNLGSTNVSPSYLRRKLNQERTEEMVKAIKTSVSGGMFQKSIVPW